MKGRVKTAFWILSTACFVAMASGGLLHLHLARCEDLPHRDDTDHHKDLCHHEDLCHHGDSDHHEEPTQHDSEHCSICQQLLVSNKGFTVDPEPVGIGLELIRRVPTAPQTMPILQVSLDGSHPRAPPA